MSLGEIWDELERVTPPGASGRVKRRIRPEARCDLFVAVAKPSNLRLLLMPVAERSLAGVEALPTGSGVETRIVRPGEEGSEAALELVLTDPKYGDIFTALATDIVQAVAPAADEAAGVSALIGRLRRWQRFLEEAGPTGLGPEAQRGLYAELWLMRHHLLPTLGPVASVLAWTGPSRTAHDFEFGRTAIEVKSTLAKQHQTLRIVSERQLDDTGLEALFLFHLSLDAHRDTGQSLPDLVDDLRQLVASTPAASPLDDGLIEAGYLDAHSVLYQNPGYAVREQNFFRVADGFPRIVERDLRSGVGDVHYSVSVAECRHFLSSPETALGRTGGGDGS